MSGFTRAWLIVAAAATIVLVVAIAALLPRAAPVESPRTSESPLAALPTPTASPTSRPTATPSRTPAAASPSPAPFEGEIVREGDLVTVTGKIINWSAGPKICAAYFVLLSMPPQPSCLDDRSLPITGVDPRDLSGGSWYSIDEPSRKVWVTDWFRVFGTWRDGVLAYVDAIPAEQPPDPVHKATPRVPCEPPAGGWPGDPETFQSGDPGGLVRRLEAELVQHPDLYAGWVLAGNRDGYGDWALRAMVVATVGDLSAVEAALREIYPANLCVVQAEFSTSGLQPVAQRLEAEEPEWFARVGGPLVNRVEVWPRFIDADAGAVFGRDAQMILARPLVEKVDSDPPLNGERICGRVDPAHCEIAVALVREARPELFTRDSIEVVDYECAPGAWCSFLAGYIVAVVPAGCPGSPSAFVVRRLEQFDRVVERPYGLPAHVADLLPLGCTAATPG